ncbi:MAG: sodium-translocating pyrophosphatase [Candidatus Portnoybacteria bacterium RIFCSPLOWO2_12_FULL_39_9]|uniref:K(+)-insensitive pyrophosphate-energized proton pump n=1 Tax=Candidatus Portnoybacteria bacterium RIFCSPHIGHO2_12_FULL_38_9 TaxID=1801997 RepID=A0A1G2FI46_9BACT|nr:MAG: sodium-translocating pyrophosphatase [Candidatus Portnoybacteria bacterium RBG_13_40_8]OGZ36274.1 MAG: sodium-translocating pyrophosphatase [Candidatus Portnoybacteria bacterium RIFCSPHIGHO2_02_FULL_39_12]OGZ37320.1 MAG: sodium-translocating pyrophosphatase [Candidatus Portnoybacteria bacterium RIFCSPHIGHO2_12_FULL_38_9]OGZ40933.1 MAG: sodium-translocating pyrophosphatase [Candidatus Portnoybacteria bacterium RIFCSPLOWO2_12_FULL_39_9]
MIYLIISISLLAIIFAFWLRQRIFNLKTSDKKAEAISEAILEGSKAYLKRQFRVVSLIALFLIVILLIFLDGKTTLGFLTGAIASALAGYLGMLTAVKSNIRVAEAAKKSLSVAFGIAFKGGSVTGFLVVGLGLFVVSLFWFLTRDINALIGLGFGGSLISVFSRLAGGIYTKAADVGADLVGKIEAGIPEDDPRNPAVIADNVGDNVGDCAGMAADLFETYAVTTIAAILLGSIIFPGLESAIILPLALGAASIVSSIIGAFFVRIRKENIMAALYKGLFASAAISALLFIPLIRFFAKEMNGRWLNLYLAGIIGLVITFLIVVITEYYTSKKFRPVQSIARASVTGHGTNIISGLAISMESTVLPIIVIGLGLTFAYWLFGLYGIAISAVSMLSLTGLIVSIDSFGPITDNAGGIAEMADFPPEARKNTDKLDAVGNTTKAITKGYAIASAGLAALVLFASYVSELTKLGQDTIFELSDPFVLLGIFIGGFLPYLFGSLSMTAVSKAASSIVNEVRRQFKEIPGLMEGEAKPNYGRAVDIATKASLKEMILPAILPILVVILTGFIFGPKTLGGLLIGVIVTGLFMAISMTSGGAAWDNAKKFIEEGNYGGKGSLAHQAAITGDTVGDPYKDTAGPAINPMIKVVNIVALLIVGFLV